MSTTITARDLQRGHVIIRAGRTTHSPITVDATEIEVDNPSGRVRVWGFNASNPVPRLMFRALLPSLPIVIEGVAL